MNNFPDHLVIMEHTAPGQGVVLCVSESDKEIAEWDLTEQNRKDFE